MRRMPPSERDQLDLFRALPDDLSPRDSQDFMAYPFFWLGKSKRLVPINFHVGGITIRVEAVPEQGMATIWDADVLIWAVSQIVGAREAGLKMSCLMAATPYEILTFVGRGSSARDYDRLKSALDRLQSTTVMTSIRQPAERRRHRFSWINDGSRTLLYMWNASASVPLGLYGLHSSNTRYVGDLVAVVPPEPLATEMGSRFSSTTVRWGRRARDSRGRQLSTWQRCRPHWRRRTLSHELASGRFIGWSVLRADAVVCRDRSSMPPLDSQGLAMHYCRRQTAASLLDKACDLSLFPAPIRQCIGRPAAVVAAVLLLSLTGAGVCSAKVNR
jgi:plasmid replication initiation protein